MSTGDETKNGSGREAARQTRRFEIALPVASAKVLEAASILGGYESLGAFIIEAAVEKSVQLNTAGFQQRIRTVIANEANDAKGRKSGKGGANES